MEKVILYPAKLCRFAMAVLTLDNTEILEVNVYLLKFEWAKSRGFSNVKYHLANSNQCTGYVCMMQTSPTLFSSLLHNSP